MSVSVDDPKKPFADLSNKSQNNNLCLKVKTSELEEGSSSTETTSLTNMINDCVEVVNGKNVEAHKKLIGDVLMKKFLNKIHHSGSAFPIDKISDDLKEILKQFHPDERISFEVEEVWNDGIVVSVERKGGAKFYVVNQNGKNLPNKINGLFIKRKFDPDDDELKDFIRMVSTKLPGKAWEVNEDLRSEYCVMNKLASVFCTTPKSKGAHKVSESSDDEVPVEQIRRSGAGLPPTSNRKIVEKKTMKLMKEKLKEDDRKKKQSENEAVKLAKKMESSKKKEQLKKEKQNQKDQEKETKKAEKEKKGDSKNSSDKKLQSIKDVFPVKIISTPTSNDAVSPPKAKEKRFQLHVSKLNSSWDAKNIKDFNDACIRAANNLSLSMIEKIENELIRFSVTKQFEAKKDIESMKGMNKENKKVYREKMKDTRKVVYNEMEPKVKNHFKLDNEYIDDLTVNTTSLPIIGKQIVVPDDRKEHFPDCLMISQFVTSLKRFFEADISHTAEEMLDAIFDGEKGYLKVSCSILKAFLGTLVNVEEYMKISHMNNRLRDLVFDEGTLSEICRAFMLGEELTITRADRSEENKARLAERRKALGLKENEAIEDLKDDEGLDEQEDEEEDDEDGRSTPDSQLEKSQIEEAEVELLLQAFKPSSNFWELSPVVQLDVMKYLMYKILDTQSYRDFVSDRSTEYVSNLKKQIQVLKDQIEEQKNIMKGFPVFDEDVDISMLSRTQTKERGEVSNKKKICEKKISDLTTKLADMSETLAPHNYMSHTSRGFAPVGQDRNRRAYYLFYTKTKDRGLWVQDFHEDKYNGLDDLENNMIFKEENKSVKVETPERENWYHIENLDDVTILCRSLNKVGSRERKLEKFLNSQKMLLASCYQMAEPQNDTAEGGEKIEDFNALLKTDILQVSKDLCESYLSDLNAAAYEARVVSAEHLDDLKSVMNALIDSIPLHAIQTDVGRDEGFFTCFKVERWKRRLNEAHNISALLLLLRILDTRIDWDKGTTEKSCTICGSKRSPDAKIACLICGKVFHYYCTRPRLQEKLLKYTCAGCRPKDKVKPVKYAEANTSEEEEEEDVENDQASSQEDEEEEDDDYFSARNRTRAAKRKASTNSLNNSKRSRNSPTRRLRTSLRNQ